MIWTLLSTALVGCSLFGSGAETTPRLTMAEVPAKLAQHTDQVVEVAGQYYAVSSGDEWLRVIVQRDGEDKDKLDCYTSVNGPKFKGASRGQDIVVSGRVAEFRGKLSLLDCDRVTE